MSIWRRNLFTILLDIVVSAVEYNVDASFADTSTVSDIDAKCATASSHAFSNPCAIRIG